MTPADILDGIMARELESEAIVTRIASSPPDDSTMDRLDQLVISAKKSDEQVWAVMEKTMMTAAAKHGWRAVKDHFSKLDVHDLLKERVETRINAGIHEDFLVSALMDRSREPRIRETFREMIAEGRSEVLAMMSDPSRADELRAIVQHVEAEHSKATDTTILNRLVQHGMQVATELNAAKLKRQMKIVEDLFAGEFVEDHARRAIAEMFAEAGEGLEDMLDNICDRDRLRSMRTDIKIRVDRMTKEKEEQTAAAEKLLVSEFIGGAHEAKARAAVEEIFAEAGDGLDDMLADCNRMHAMRMDVKTRVHQMIMRCKAKQADDDFKAAEAKAMSIATELVRQEIEERKAAELRAAKCANRQRAKRELQASKAASKAAMAAAKEAADAAQREALKAARREAQRQEEEDRAARKAIALVEAALAATARRAAKKAEKREKKAQQVIVALTLSSFCPLTNFPGGQHLRNLLRALRRQA